MTSILPRVAFAYGQTTSAFWISNRAAKLTRCGHLENEIAFGHHGSAVTASGRLSVGTVQDFSIIIYVLLKALTIVAWSRIRSWTVGAPMCCYRFRGRLTAVWLVQTHGGS